ncbi:MAG: molybdenum cofactor guanylyltransferase [Parasphingorhabdus sp.]
MADAKTDYLVILAGGQSRRMGRDKALVEIHGLRMLDHMIDRFHSNELPIALSAAQDYATGLEYVPDNPNYPDGPVGAIFSVSEYFAQREPPVNGFYTVPVDAPHAPLDLIAKLKAPHSCAIASSNGQVHPVFAYWDCDTVQSVKQSYGPETKAPSLQWLARQCGAETVEWIDDNSFANINTPEELSTINKEQ